MSDRPLKIFLIDRDPVFRLGLRVVLEEIPTEVQAIGSAETSTAAMHNLAELTQNGSNQLDLIVLGLANIANYKLDLELVQQLKSRYPHLPILLLVNSSDPKLLSLAKKAGVDGHCLKGTSVSSLVAAMRLAVSGDQIASEEENKFLPHSPLPTPHSPFPFARQRNKLRLSGVSQIERRLKEVTEQLQVPGLSVVEKAILAGTRRELLAARWFVNQLLSAPQEREQQTDAQLIQRSPLSSSDSDRAAIAPVNSIPTAKQLFPLSPRALQSELFASCIDKLQFPLQNVTETFLEIDILRLDKKRELLYLILQKFADILDELRANNIKIEQLPSLNEKILHDLWQDTTTEFFGKFSLLNLEGTELEIVNILLQEAAVVQTEILAYIPLTVDLLSYLLFQTDLYVDNTDLKAGSFAANEQALMLLENLFIQVANAVVQPLLNKFADVEIIKQTYYDRKLISTREIERFRNNLSWKYRMRNYFNEPQAIFESRYELFVFAPRGIAQTSIYAPRGGELAQLSGIALGVTLGFEIRDAIAPRLQSLLSFLGSGVVFILTQVIGRGLGLIGRGILQGIGSASLPEKNRHKK